MDEISWKARISHARQRAAESGQRQVLRGRWWPHVGWAYYTYPKGSVSDFMLQSQREAQMATRKLTSRG